MRKFSAFLKEERSQMPQQMQRKVFGESKYCGIQEMLAFKFKVNLDFHHHFFNFSLRFWSFNIIVIFHMYLILLIQKTQS